MFGAEHREERWRGAVHGGNGALVRARNRRAPLLAFAAESALPSTPPLERESLFHRCAYTRETNVPGQKPDDLRVLVQHHRPRTEATVRPASG